MGLARRTARGVLQRTLARLDERGRGLREIRYGDPRAAMFGAFGEGSVIEHPISYVTYPQSILIGANVRVLPGAVLEAIDPTKPVITLHDGAYIGRGVRVVAINGVDIGLDVAIGHGTTLADTIHDYKPTPRGGVHWQAPLKVGRPLVIERGAWIGISCVVHGGVTIGEGAIVGALSVIGRDVPPYTMVAGNPARAIRRRIGDEWEWLVDPASVELDTDGAPFTG